MALKLGKNFLFFLSSTPVIFLIHIIVKPIIIHPVVWINYIDDVILVYI